MVAMTSHPPVPVSELASHVERLRANSGARFSTEYESIDPGQQLTWVESVDPGQQLTWVESIDPGQQLTWVESIDPDQQLT